MVNINTCFSIALRIIVDGFTIFPPLGLGSWAASAACGDTAIMMRDIIDNPFKAAMNKTGNGPLNNLLFNFKSPLDLQNSCDLLKGICYEKNTCRVFFIHYTVHYIFPNVKKG